MRRVLLPPTLSVMSLHQSEEEIDGLRHDKVEADHVPDQPAIGGAGVRIAEQAVGCGDVVLL
jgi:hypothetical protein